jgi:hypothetical protein
MQHLQQREAKHLGDLRALQAQAAADSGVTSDVLAANIAATQEALATTRKLMSDMQEVQSMAEEEA